MAHKNEKYVIGLRNYLFRVPSIWILLFLFLLVIGAFSYLIRPHMGEVIFLFILPYLLVISVDYLIIKGLKIYFPLRRIATLNLVPFIISFWVMWLLMFFFPFYFSFYLAFSFVIYIRFIIYRVFLSGRNIMSGIISTNYNLLILLTSLIYNTVVQLIFPYILSIIIYGFMAYMMVNASTSKFRREFREDPFFFVSSFVNYLARYERIDKEKIDNFFKNIYEERSVPVSTLVFRNEKGVKFSFVFPYVHPGPFGDIGGSNIPNKLEEYLKVDNLFVFHTTTTHDDNIASEKDVKKIGDAVADSLNCPCKYDNFSDFHRLRVNNIDVGIHIFGRYPLIFLLPTHEIFDDVELKTGLTIRRKINTVYEDSAIIDAHNNFDDNALPLSLPTSDSSIIKGKIREIRVDKKMRAGFSVKKIAGKSIGPGGVRATVFEYGDKKIAYILLDGNNIKKGLRNKIIENLKDLVDEIEVFSTDNHIVNISLVDLNPIGDKDDWNMLIKAGRDAINEAIKNIEDVCVCMNTKMVKMRMAYPGQLKKLTDITRMSVGRAKLVAPISLILGFILSFLAFYLLR